jgi:hypothetical protein
MPAARLREAAARRPPAARCDQVAHPATVAKPMPKSRCEMYDNQKLCEKLKPKEICLVVEQYTEGIFERQFHEHIPKRRLSESALQNLLQALAFKFENNELRD